MATEAGSAPATGDVDLGEVRQHLFRLAGVQSGLLALIVLFAVFLGGLNAWVTAWIALLPVIVAAWALLYYRSLQRAHPEGRAAVTAASKGALRVLGVLGLGWAVGLGVVWVLAG